MGRLNKNTHTPRHIPIRMTIGTVAADLILTWEGVLQVSQPTYPQIHFSPRVSATLFWKTKKKNLF